MTSPATSSSPSSQRAATERALTERAAALTERAAALAERTLEHIRFLAEVIGPRPAGSQAERQAFNYAETRLVGWSYHTQRARAWFAPLPALLAPAVFGALWLLVSSLGLAWLPWLAIWTALLFAALPELEQAYLRSRRLTMPSENLYASLPGPAQGPLLILCAHLDSARAAPFSGQSWRKLSYHTPALTLRVAIFIAALAALLLLGLRLPQALLILAGGLGVLTSGWLLLSQWRAARCQQYVPGALDNASGAGLLLALAEYYATQPPANVRLGFLFTGAEESGMHGADAFAKYLNQEKIEACIINLDMVGAGNELNYASSVGLFFPIRMDAGLNERVRAANPQAKAIRHTLRSGDHAAFARRGIPAALLETAGSSAADLAYHTPDDTLAMIQLAALKNSAWTLLKLIEDF